MEGQAAQDSFCFQREEAPVCPNSSAGMGMGSSCLSLAGWVCGNPLKKSLSGREASLTSELLTCKWV